MSTLQTKLLAFVWQVVLLNYSINNCATRQCEQIGRETLALKTYFATLSEANN